MFDRAPSGRQSRVSRAVWGWVARLALATPLGCGALPSWPSPPNQPGANTATTPAPGPESRAFECRDWSGLDPATLPALPPAPWMQTFEAAWRTVLQKHYDPTLGCLDWPALRLTYGEQLARAATTEEAFEVMNAMLRELGQSHLAVIPPRPPSDGAADETSSGPGMIPVRVRLLDGVPIITQNAVFGRSSGLPLGATLVSIEGKDVTTEIERLREAHDREVEVAAHAAHAIQERLTCPVGAARTVVVQPIGETKAQRSVVACLEPAVERMSMGNLVDLPVELQFGRVPNSTIAWIRFNLWLLPLVPRLEAALTELRREGATSLIVDLRGNPGGVGAMVVALGRLLLTENASLGELRTRDTAYTFKVAGSPDAFAGPVVVLLDEGSASTSEIFAQALQDLGRAVVIAPGPSQGAALPSLVEALPGGARIQFVVGDYTSPRGVRIEGQGVQPQLLVRERASDFAAGRDPVFEAAVLHLQKNR